MNLAVALFLGGAVLAAATPQDPPPTKVQAIALIVHPDNPLTDVKYAHLRSYLRLDRQFWPDKRRVSLILPAAGSLADKVLGERIYRMDAKRLKKHWIGKVFAGDIPAVPQAAKSAAAAGRMVAGSKGAISAVAADEVPKGVRVLRVDGHAPGAEGYPLNVGPSSAPSAAPGSPR